MRFEQAIADDKDFWIQNANPTRDQGLAFNALSNLLTSNKFQNIETDVDIDAIEDPGLIDQNLDVVKLLRKMEHFEAVELRFFTLDTVLYAQNPDLYKASPSRKYLIGKKQTAPFSYIKAHIYELENSLVALKKQICTLEDKFAQSTAKARDNAKPVLTTELASNLMYCLHSNDPEKKWLSQEQLETMLDGGRKEAAFLGLMQQRLRRTNGVGLLSASGLADFVRLTVKDRYLPDPAAPDSVKALDTWPSSQSFFCRRYLNRLMELPLVTDVKNPGKYIALKKNEKAWSKFTTL